MTLIINEGNCNGEAEDFATFVQQNHPEIRVDFRARTTGIGGGLFDSKGTEIEDVDLWAEFCNS